MNDNETALGKVKRFGRKLTGALPTLSIPALGSVIDIPVYVVHNASDPNDYFFIFDFEQFVEASRGGIFVRPRLLVWAGRDDFGRRQFAKRFRESFAAEFEAARGALAQGTNEKPKGWFGWALESNILDFNLAAFAANVVLLVGVSAGKMALNAIPIPSLLKGKSDHAKLEQSIEDTKSKVDTALEAMNVTLHSELADHAYKGNLPADLAGLKYDEWPLPHYVSEHLSDNQSTAWW